MHLHWSFFKIRWSKEMDHPIGRHQATTKHVQCTQVMIVKVCQCQIRNQSCRAALPFGDPLNVWPCMTKCCTQDVSIKRREEQPVHSGGHAATFSNAGFYMGFWWFWLLLGAQTWQEVEATLLLAVPVMCWKSVRLCGVWRMVLVNQLACWIVAFDGVWMYFIFDIYCIRY